MTDDTQDNELTPDALVEALQQAAKNVDFDEVRKQAEEGQQFMERFPEHAKTMALSRELMMLHTFVEHFLHDHRHIVLAVQDEDGTLTPYEEDPNSDNLLLPEFFGIDQAKFREEEPGVAAYAHQKQSEREADNPDPALAVQMAEFEAMLASMDDEPTGEDA